MKEGGVERVKVFIYLSEDVEDLASLVHGELPQTSGQTTSDGETTLVGSDGTAKVPVISLHGDGLAGDGSALSTVGDGSSDGAREGEEDSEVVAGGSLDGARGLGLDEVLTLGEEVESPCSGSSDNSLVVGGDADGDWVTVGVAGVSGPSVLKEVVLGVQVDVVDVESDGHDDGKRGVQCVVVVEEIVDEGDDVVGGGEDSLLSVDSESSGSVEVMVDVTSELVADHTELVGGEFHTAGGTALRVWFLVLLELVSGKT